MKLYPASEAKRCKGMFMVWKYNASYLPFPRIRIAKVAKKNGDTLISEFFDRIPVHKAWLVESAGDWPKSEGAMRYNDLTEDEAREVLQPEWVTTAAQEAG